MSNIDKEWLQQKIADMEATRDEIPFGLDEDDSNTLAAMKLALASLEAEAVAFRSKLKPPYAGSERWDYTDHRQPDAFELENCFIERLYTAPPAPVSVPDAMEMDDDFDSAFEHGKAVGWNAYRAAMLQSFGNSEQLNSPVIPDGWVLVPEEPTHEMLEAGDEQFGTYDVYRRMIAASPQQEVMP
ncbi:hypothetical protein Q3W73_11955 [Klebsiella pneumoniae]|uniref:hypothetical protein n=1 Tax=Klebsiella pneumoniae TaxID=573 RepID=UPI002E10F45F|nr:hypothetical protein Q3W73_11955 [Klebsiella pneumoniae]